MSLRAHLRTLHSLAPANKDLLSALRVAVSVAVPSSVLLAAGRPGLIIYAVFGALTGMYGLSEALLAAAGSLFADKVGLKPNGPFFGIFALGACASIPTAVPWPLAILI